MVGIVSWNAYIPFYRLDSKDIANAWKTKLPEGERTVANYDEDSITMAVEAGMNCLAFSGYHVRLVSKTPVLRNDAAPASGTAPVTVSDAGREPTPAAFGWWQKVSAWPRRWFAR